MSRKIPPEPRTYSIGGGAGSRLEIRTSCGSPTSPRITASWTAWWAGSKRRLNPIWNGHAGRLDRAQRAVDLGQLERDRLLAEDRLAGARGGHDQVGVGLGARADRHGVDGRVGEQLVDRRVRARADRLRGGRDGVVDGGESRARDLAVEQVGVHAPDPADADHADAHRRGPDGHRTSSQRPERTDSSSAACTRTNASASSKPGECGRRATSERQNS